MSLPDTSTDQPSGPPAGSDRHAAFQELRERAEQRRRLVTQDAAAQTPEHLQRLVQELQVHQIELEMQHEQLQMAQLEAEIASARYLDLYDFAPVSYLTLSDTGTIEQLNLHAARLLETTRQRLQDRRFALFVYPDDRFGFGQFLAQVFASEHAQRQELRLRPVPDGPHVLHVRLEALRVPGPRGPQCRLVVVDLTEHRAAEEARAATEARFRATFEQSNDGGLLFDEQRVVDLNAAALRLLELPDKAAALGQGLARFWPEHQPDGHLTQDRLHRCYQRALSNGWCRVELLRHRSDGRARWDELSLNPVLANGRPLMHAVWRDVTEARAVAEQLRREKDFRESLLENSVDSVLALDREGRVTAWNAEAARCFGHEAAAVLGCPVFEVLPQLAAGWGPALAQAQRGRRAEALHCPFGNRPGHHDAYFVPLQPPGDAAPVGVLAVVRDVTERDRLAEEATQLRLRQQQDVLAAILDTQEEERRRIAEALHNGLGQLLYATKLSLEAPGLQVPPAPVPTIKLLNEAIRTTRTISHELTPGVLEDFGLRIGLEELAKRLTASGLPVQLHLQDLDERLPATVEIAVYRMVQELLNNVMKHAQASEVVAHVAREDGHLDVLVEDNGQGFDASRLGSEPMAGVGLAGVRNRVALLGGTLRINSQRGRGTIVSMELPL